MSEQEKDKEAAQNRKWKMIFMIVGFIGMLFVGFSQYGDVRTWPLWFLICAGVCGAWATFDTFVFLTTRNKR